MLSYCHAAIGSSTKPTGATRKALVIRCYNASGNAQSGILECPRARRIRAVNFLERPVRIDVRRLRQGIARIRLRPFQIVNLQVLTE